MDRHLYIIYCNFQCLFGVIRYHFYGQKLVSMEVIPPCGTGWSTVQCPVSSCVFFDGIVSRIGSGADCRFDLIDMFSSCVQYVEGLCSLYSVGCTDSIVLFHISYQPITLDTNFLDQSSRFGP